MTASDLVYKEVYKGCLAEKCSEQISKNAAIMTLKKYKANQFITVSKLIKQEITDAKKIDKKKKR